MNAPVSMTLLPSAARTATPTISEQVNLGHGKARIVIDVTAVTGSPDVAVTVELKSAAGTWSNRASTIHCIAVGQYEVLADIDAAVWRVTATHGNGNSITYSIVADLLP